MDYSQEYKQKLVSADEAVKLIKSGDWVDFGWCTNTVDALDQALAKRTDELTNVNLRGGILLKPLATFAREVGKPIGSRMGKRACPGSEKLCRCLRCF